MNSSLQSYLFSVYLVFTWIGRLIFISGVLYFMYYVKNHRDFYLGIGLKEATIQQYLIVIGNLLILLASAGFFFRKRKWLSVYVTGKIIELAALIWAVPVYVDALGSAFKGLNKPLFTIFLLLAIVSLWLLFLLITISFKNLLRN